MAREEKKEWTHFTDSSRADTSSQSSDADDSEDQWSMGEDLRKYYVQQFQTMQKDLNGVISGMIDLLITSPMCHHLPCLMKMFLAVSGSVAKEFFQKSNLKMNELAKVW